MITSDLVVVFKGRVVEKPQTKQEAYDTIFAYKTDPAQTVCSVVVVNTKTGKRAEGTDVVTIYFRPFTKEAVEEFVESGKILDHAGSFAAEQEPFSSFIDKLDGTIESVAGLSVELTKKLIESVK